MPQETLWYYLEAGKVLGPVTVAQLQQMGRAGRLTQQSQICREGTQDWVELSRLRLDLRAVPPPVATEIPPPEPTVPASAAAFSRSIGSEHSLFDPGWVFDWRFQKFVTPQIVQAVWLLWLVGAMLGLGVSVVLTVIGLVQLPLSASIVSILTLMGTFLGTILSTMLLRMSLEFLINMFQMARQTPR
jgi:hypothetical protein